MSELRKLAALVEWLRRLETLGAAVSEWEVAATTDVLANRTELERRIGWQMLSLTGAYSRHAHSIAVQLVKALHLQP